MHTSKDTPISLENVTTKNSPHIHQYNAMNCGTFLLMVVKEQQKR